MCGRLEGQWNASAPSCWPSAWTVCDTRVILGHFRPQAFDQAVTKDTCMAVGFFQRGVANFQLER